MTAALVSLAWASVVLILGVLFVRALRWRWQSVESLTVKTEKVGRELTGLRAECEGLARMNRAAWDAAEARLSEVEQFRKDVDELEVRALRIEDRLNGDVEDRLKTQRHELETLSQRMRELDVIVRPMASARPPAVRRP